MKRILPILLAILGLAACNDKATLDNSRVRYITYEGRKFEVRVAATDVPNEYRLLVVRATLVVNPDPERERARIRLLPGRQFSRSAKAETLRSSNTT